MSGRRPNAPNDPPAGPDSAAPADLREAFLLGDPASVETVRKWVWGMVRGGGWRLSDPEAAVQEVVLRLLTLGRSGVIRSDSPFKSFVMMLARHTCTDIYRRERLRGRIEIGGAPVEAHAEPPGAEAAVEREERLQLLRFVYQQLPEECRRLWRLVYSQGLPANEVGQRLGITPNTARVRVHRCLARAREIRSRYLAPAGRERGDPNDE